MHPGMAEILKDYPGWDYDDTYGDFDGNLICPCGHAIEWDGECPEGCVSPLRQAGMI